jgi:hypothetical protein
MNKLSLLIGLVTFAYFFLFPVLAQTSTNDTVDVFVDIQAVAQITVVPDVLNWSVTPGAVGGTKFVDIKNTGSVNITNIYAFVDTLTDEPERPYGSTNATKYAAGGLIVLKNETYNKYFWAGRIEWNWTDDISGMDKNGVSSPVAWGFFKNTTFEYNWLVGNGTGGYCNNTGAQFAIEDDADNGTVVTRTPIATGITLDARDSNFGYFSVNRATAPLSESCVAVSFDCKKIFIYRYDKRPGFSSCANSRYLQTSALVPGDIHTLTLDIWTPLGIPAGNLNTATITIVGTG